MSLHVINRPVNSLFSLGNEKEIRALVDRAVARGWCKRPKLQTRDEEMELLRQRIAELEGSACVE